MAGGGKVYTLTFLLKAASDSSYQAAFSKAKQELNQFQKEIQQNNSLLKDISGYERQEQAVARAAAKLKEKEAALEKTRKAAEAAGNANEKLNSAQTRAEAAVKNATERLLQQTQKLDTQRAALQQAGIDTDNLAEEQQRLANATESLKQQQEAQAEAQNQQIQAIPEMEAMAAEAYTAIQVVEQLAVAWSACIDAAGGFQYAMSATESVSQATTAEMSELTAVAKEVGATTIFTATQIAQAMEYMGLAGWSAEEMIEGIPHVANLAAGAGEDLSRVCDIVTDSMMALGYGTEDTAHFCDVLAQTSRTANTNVDKMGDSLKYVSSTAGALGYSIEDVATVMAALANSGIKADMAGTSLRNILASLADPSDEAAEALEELNIHLADSEGQAYDLNNVITQIRQGFAGLSQEEQVHYASMIAGKRGMTGVLSLVNTTQKKYDELAETIRDCDGAAQQMAGTRLDNYQGSVIILQSAFDALKTSIGEAYLDAGQKGVETLTLMTNAANDFVIQNQSLVVGATAAAGAFGAMAVGVTAVTAAMKICNAVFAGTILANPAFWGAAAIVAGATGIAAAIVHIGESADDAGKSVETLLDEIETGQENRGLIEEYEEVSQKLQEAGLSAEETAEYESWLAEVTAQLKEEYPELLGNIEAGTEAWNLQTEAILANIEASERENLSELAGHAEELAAGYKRAAEGYEEASQAGDRALENLKNVENVDFNDTIKHIQELYDSLTGDIEKGTIEIDLEEGSEFYARMQEMQNAAQNVSGVKLDWELPSDVSEWLERNKGATTEAADVMAVYSREYSDAMDNMTRSSSVKEEDARLLRQIAEAGYSIGPALQEAGVSLTDIGVTSEYIGEQISTGIMTADEAMGRYGISAVAAERAVRAYEDAQITAARATGETEAKTVVSNATLERYGRAIAAVNGEVLDVSTAAKMWGLSEEELQGVLEENEAQEKLVAGAAKTVEAGFLTAEEATKRFGVSMEELQAYEAQQELETLEQELEELQKEYDAAYDSALSSIQSQGSLLEGLSLDADRTKLTLTDALENMEEMESYWASYHDNMSLLQGYGLSTDFLTRFCDTSADGVANTQDLADRLSSLNDSDRDAWIDDLNGQFQELVEQEGTTASATAEMKTQYSTTAAVIEGKMAEMEGSVSASINTMVSNMNKSGSAYANGYSTANAYVRGIRSQITAAKAAAAKLAAAGTPSSRSWSYGGGKAHGGFTSGPELAGEDPRYPVEAVISFNPAYHEQNVKYLKRAAAMLGVGIGPETVAVNLPNGGTQQAQPHENYVSKVLAAQRDDGNGESLGSIDLTGYAFGGLTEYGAEVFRAFQQSREPEQEREAPIYMGSTMAETVPTSIATIQNAPQIFVTEGMTREDVLEMLNANNEEIVDAVFERIAQAKRNERRSRFV